MPVHTRLSKARSDTAARRRSVIINQSPPRPRALRGLTSVVRPLQGSVFVGTQLASLKIKQKQQVEAASQGRGARREVIRLQHGYERWGCFQTEEVQEGLKAVWVEKDTLTQLDI